MLVQLTINNYAIVDHLELELSSGMSTITGETGAGKSIMLDALGLALGDRAEAGVVRPDADKAEISATFDLKDIPEAKVWLAERDLIEDDVCILRRVITPEGRSRAYINGSSCTLGDLKALGEHLIDIHSQHEHQSLLKPETHRRLLDEFATTSQLASEVAQLANQWRSCKNKLEQLTNSNEQQRAQHQLLSYQLEELEQLSLGDNELDELENEHRTLTNAVGLLQNCQQVIELCSENDSGNVLSTLNNCLHRLSSMQGAPQALTEATNLIASAQIQIEEAVGELNHFCDHFDADPERQQWIEARLDAIYSLARKHRVQPHELNQLQQDLFVQLEALNADDSQQEQLNIQVNEFAKNYQTQAEKLSKKRSQATKKLSEAVQQQMQKLGMPGGRFAIELSHTNTTHLDPNGLENIEFQVSANPGQPLRALVKVASGGELSRISLAIQVITAQTSRIPSLVFDEVDVGIGGPTAEIVGQLLRQLGERGQVLTVTHLPQVAAQGHQHLFVHKKRAKNSTSTAVSRLTDEQRIEEVARMLGGIELTEESLAHAKQLLQRH